MIAEPTTTLTDLALAALSFALAWRLGQAASTAKERRAAEAIAKGLWAMGSAAALGGVTHGFRPILSETVASILWVATLAAIGATAFLITRSLSFSHMRGSARRLLQRVALAQLVLYLAWIVFHDQFVWAILDYLPVLSASLVAHAASAWRGRAGSSWIAAGFAVSLLGAAIQASGLTLHPAFNHNDLYHVIQMIGTGLLYRGATELRDAG